MTSKKNILIAPLNWGLGHATRCIPLIQKLLKEGFNPIIASDGTALQLLQKEFPLLSFEKLPSYNIKYSKSGIFLLPFLLLQSPKVLSAIAAERKTVERLHKKYNFSGIISDNRYGVIHSDVPSVIVSHQLQLPSKLGSLIQSKYIRQFQEIWVPDTKEQILSGQLSNNRYYSNIKHIGALSRFNKEDIEDAIEILVVLSGVEPLRTKMEHKIFKELSDYKAKVTVVRGVVENERLEEFKNDIAVFNFCTSSQLEKLLNQAKTVVARSGYSTIMDLSKLGKKAFLIPTEGQPEQQYLARHLEHQQIAPYCQLKDFSKNQLQRLKKYPGFKSFENKLPEDLFHLFERE